MKRRKKEHPNAQGLTIDWRDIDPSVDEERLAFLKAASNHKSIRLGDSLHDNVWKKIQEEEEKYESSEESSDSYVLASTDIPIPGLEHAGRRGQISRPCQPDVRLDA